MICEQINHVKTTPANTKLNVTPINHTYMHTLIIELSIISYMVGKVAKAMRVKWHRLRTKTPHAV